MLRGFRTVGFSALKQVERLIARRSLVGDHAIFDTADFPWVADLEANWETMRAELDGILKHRAAIRSF